jgi:hypothetical protein
MVIFVRAMPHLVTCRSVTQPHPGTDPQILILEKKERSAESTSTRPFKHTEQYTTLTPGKSFRE